MAFKSLQIIIYLEFIKKNNNAASPTGEAAKENVGCKGPTHFSSAVKKDWQEGLLSILVCRVLVFGFMLV